ncbi:MAG: hypothetical protein LBU32_05025 [Clostridiales bacterium]|nr:hypothetical protein [Clostridiales bacterium]
MEKEEKPQGAEDGLEVPADVSTNASKGPKEKLYDKIPLTLHQLDIVIVCLIILLIVFFVIGSLVGNGIIEGPKFMG